MDINGDFGFNDLAAGWSVLEQMRLDDERRRRQQEEDDRRRQELLNQNNSILSQPPNGNYSGLNITGSSPIGPSSLNLIEQLYGTRPVPDLNPTQPNNPFGEIDPATVWNPLGTIEEPKTGKSAGTIANIIDSDSRIEEVYRRASKTGEPEQPTTKDSKPASLIERILAAETGKWPPLD